MIAELHKIWYNESRPTISHCTKFHVIRGPVSRKPFLNTFLGNITRLITAENGLNKQ